MKRISLLLLLGIISITLTLTGCAGFPRKSSPDQDYAQQTVSSTSKILKFDDVPVPAGFRIIDADSFTFQNRDLRIGLLKYTGRVNPSEAVEFYKENMPMYNWNLINVVEYGRRIMNFERAGQSCIVTLEPTSFYTVLIIAVAPRATAPMQEEEIKEYKEYRVVK